MLTGPLFTAEGLEESIAARLYDERFGRERRRHAVRAGPAARGVFPGIQVDPAHTLAASQVEGDRGLDGLRAGSGVLRAGARFAKWRAVITICDWIRRPLPPRTAMHSPLLAALPEASSSHREPCLMDADNYTRSVTGTGRTLRAPTQRFGQDVHLRSPVEADMVSPEVLLDAVAGREIGA